MGAKAAIMFKSADGTIIRGFTLDERDVLSVGPKLIILDTEEKVKSYFEKPGVSSEILDKNFNNMLNLKDPYPVYYFDGSKGEWTYKRASLDNEGRWTIRKLPLREKMYEVLLEQLESERENLQKIQENITRITSQLALLKARDGGEKSSCDKTESSTQGPTLE